MEFFHEPKIDWMGKKWLFIGVSIPLLLAGLISMAVKRGLAYGIDFRGGTLVYVKFAGPPNLDRIRAELDRQNLKGATLQQFGPAADHAVIVGLDLKTTASASALDAGKRTIGTALAGLYGEAPAGKTDFNNVSPQALGDSLAAADPLQVASKGGDIQAQYKDLANALYDFLNSPQQGGLITDFQQLSGVRGVTPAVVSFLKDNYYLSNYAISRVRIVGPKVGADLRRQAVYVTLAGLGAMLIYIWYRFELIYGVAAVIATFHDVLITLGIFSLFNKEITLTVIAALLTLVGYSMNDTIVVFDRIRENVRLNKRESMLPLVNRSINQTLSRTILTSGLTFLAVLSLYLFGGEVIHGFATVLVVGVIIGTYSSIAIASPVLVYWQQRTGGGTRAQSVGTSKGSVSAPPAKSRAERQTAGARR
ncbi:MAG TPA: protein translocase subunit SecF [Terriglobia bacterium]|nr:protein translocase subunit SecF [Terriglobia bacterium]